MVFKILAPLLLVLVSLLNAIDARARGVGGHHGGYGGGYQFRGYHGGFGVGGMYEGALDGPRGFSGYGSNWSGYRGGYGTGTATAHQGGRNLGYPGAGGLPGVDDHTRPSRWSRGVAGWHGELGTGGGYANLGYVPPTSPVQRTQLPRHGTSPQLPGFMYGPAGELGASHAAHHHASLPTDLSLHRTHSPHHSSGYLGEARGLTPFNPAHPDSVRQAEAAQQRFAQSARSSDDEAPRVAAAARDPITQHWSAAELRTRGNAIRKSVLAAAAVNPTWYDDYAGAWIAANIVGDLWTPAPWTTVNSWFGKNWPAVAYNYGSEITSANGHVNLYGVPIATSVEYAESATKLAEKGVTEPAKSDAWLPLGVFAAVRGNAESTNMLMQLAVDKSGIIRGNYFNITSKNNQQIEGAVDEQTQRVTWFVKDRTNIVLDTGLYNLTQDETTVLVHLGKDETEQWTLVRLTRPNTKPKSSQE